MLEHVIVAGDTGNGLIGLKMLQKLKRKGHQIFAVDGNHGHTHRGMDTVVDGVRVVTNPRGYPRENPNWAPKTITLEI